METNGFKFLYDLLSQSNGNLKVCELPFLFKRRRSGKSKLNVYNIFLYLFSLINNYFFLIMNNLKNNLLMLYKRYQNKK